MKTLIAIVVVMVVAALLGAAYPDSRAAIGTATGIALVTIIFMAVSALSAADLYQHGAGAGCGYDTLEAATLAITTILENHGWKEG